MYGLINQAVEDLAVKLGGDTLWAIIKHRAGVDLTSFVALQAYDDDVTFRLVDAAGDVLGISPDAVLQAFGEHWVRYTGRTSYGPMFAAMGRTLPEFLRNLDGLHARIALSMPELRPPSFGCEELADGRLVVRYWSERAGLAPMVTGLLIGLGTLFDLDVAVTTLPRSGADHDSFLVVYQPVGAG